MRCNAKIAITLSRMGMRKEFLGTTDVYFGCLADICMYVNDKGTRYPDFMYNRDLWFGFSSACGAILKAFTSRVVHFGWRNVGC